MSNNFNMDRGWMDEADEAFPLVDPLPSSAVAVGNEGPLSLAVRTGCIDPAPLTHAAERAQGPWPTAADLDEEQGPPTSSPAELAAMGYRRSLPDHLEIDDATTDEGFTPWQ